MSVCKATVVSPTPRRRSNNVLNSAFAQAIAEFTPQLPLAVAYSGGPDSTALLLACAQKWPGQVLAIHVHHGVQVAADSFEQHCRETCARIGVPLNVIRVDGRHAPGQSPEDAARRARYQAFDELAKDAAGSFHSLAIAQHADDQIETLLLALSRGAGLPGLSAMPARWSRGGLSCYRPLLGVPASDIRAWLESRSAEWVLDPSNANEQFTRNRIRARLLPALQENFPEFRDTFARSAAHAAQAQMVLQEVAAQDLELVGTPPQITSLQRLSQARQANLLRHWLKAAHAVVPSTAQLKELMHQIACCTTRGHKIRIKVGSGFVQRRGAGLHWYNSQVQKFLPDSPMALIVHKYGGTSMGSTERIRNVAKRVAKWARAGHQMVVVPSAMSGETNRLLALAKELAPARTTDAYGRELDMLAATGEQASSALLAIALQAEGLESVSYAGWQVPIRTDSAYTKARIESIDDARVRNDLKVGRVVIVTGFQGLDELGNITTLGRGGSDTSAVAVAAAMKADECLIYTDVDGVYTTDPRVVPEARRLHTVSFEEMLEMASMGSKVLQIRSVEFAGKYKVPLRVLSSFTPWDIDINEEAVSGTLITFEEDEHMEKAIVSGIAFSREEAKISVLGVPDRPGIAFQILGAVADANIDVDVIIQNISKDGKTDFSFTVNRGDYNKTVELLKEKVLPSLGAQEVVGDAKICKVSIVGIGMRSHVGVASKMFRVLSEEGINIQMISTSEIKTSVVIDEKYMELAVRALHKAFELDQPPA